MKRNAIVRIVLFSIALLVLLSVLGVALAAKYFMFDGTSFVKEGASDGNSVVTKSPVPLAESEDIVSTSLDAEGIHELEIEWTAGNITILPKAETTQITITEPKQTQSKYQMRCTPNGSKLKIEFWQQDLVIHNTDISKDLIITVPTDWICQELDIDSASANVEVSNLTIGSIEFDGASGICTFTDCTVDRMDMDTASGDIRFTGTLNILECDAMSANCQLTVNNCPSHIDVSSMSGDLDLTLPENCGFTVAMDAMSSDFSSDFQTSTSNGHHVHGDGSCRIHVDAMSGDVTIRKGTVHHDEHH